MDVIGLESCPKPLHGRVFKSGAVQQPFVPKGTSNLKLLPCIANRVLVWSEVLV